HAQGSLRVRLALPPWPAPASRPGRRSGSCQGITATGPAVNPAPRPLGSVEKLALPILPSAPLRRQLDRLQVRSSQRRLPAPAPAPAPLGPAPDLGAVAGRQPGPHRRVLAEAAQAVGVVRPGSTLHRQHPGNVGADADDVERSEKVDADEPTGAALTDRGLESV